MLLVPQDIMCPVQCSATVIRLRIMATIMMIHPIVVRRATRALRARGDTIPKAPIRAPALYARQGNDRSIQTLEAPVRFNSFKDYTQLR